MMSGGVEAGGTKFICVTGSSAQHVDSEARFPTRTPEETLAAATAFFSKFVSSGGRLDAVGIASFGPVELRRSNPEYGFIKLSLIHISEPTRRTPISYAVFCLKKK